MYWTLELASYLSDAPWPASKDELIDFSIRTGAPLEVVENLQSLEDEGDAIQHDALLGEGEAIQHDAHSLHHDALEGDPLQLLGTADRVKAADAAIAR